MERIRKMRLIHFVRSKLSLWLIWFLEGILVGVGAILPGVSGGTLCVAFGMYRPIIETLSHICDGLKRYGRMLGIFFLGAGVGFMGLSGIASWMLETDSAFVTCLFAGFIFGTLPELWRDAGMEGRDKKSWMFMLGSFVLMLLILILLRKNVSITIAPGISAYLFCGLLWGLSVIVPGLSSSSLLLLFGLYQPMLKGISTLDLSVVLPLGLGIAACVGLLSRAMHLAYQKCYSAISHSILGIVVATAIMILPWSELKFGNVTCIAGGAAVSYLLGMICEELKKKAEIN